eukprot:6395510-Prymnesium_polylepis.1
MQPQLHTISKAGYAPHGCRHPPFQLPSLLHHAQYMHCQGVGRTQRRAEHALLVLLTRRDGLGLLDRRLLHERRDLRLEQTLGHPTVENPHALRQRGRPLAGCTPRDHQRGRDAHRAATLLHRRCPARLSRRRLSL